MRVVAVIPTQGRDTLVPLLGLVPTVVVATSPITIPPGTPDTVVMPTAKEPINIQRWWNAGLDAAMGLGGDVVAVLNDDVSATTQGIIDLAVAASGGISYVTPPWAERETPCTGYAFGIDPHVIRLDEGYEWWWGEHDLYKRAVRDGLTVAPVAADIRHLRTDGAYPIPDDVLLPMIDRDRERWLRLWCD